MTATAYPLLTLPSLTRLQQLHCGVVQDGSVRPVGDCYRTAIASTLGLSSPTEVPHFADITEDLVTVVPLGWETYRLARRWLRERGMDMLPVTVEGAAESGVRYIASVNSRRGDWSHVVVAMGRRVIHDPSSDTLAELGLEPYTFADVVAAGYEALVFVDPYDPGPDAQLVQFAIETRALDLDQVNAAPAA